jgi:hypothetical protein
MYITEVTALSLTSDLPIARLARSFLSLLDLKVRFTMAPEFATGLHLP